MKNISKTALLLCMTMALGITGCGQEEKSHGQQIPENLAGKSFVYDELEAGEGTDLYTLRFTDDRYYLNRDGGEGVLASGELKESSGGKLEFSDEKKTFSGSYSGSAFVEPSVTLDYQGKEMKMVPTTDTTEYVYLSYLGVYEGTLGKKDAVLILDRWFEYYLYSDGSLDRGTYEIYSDHRISFSPYDGKEFGGTVKYDPEKTDITFKIKNKEGSFQTAEPSKFYDAAHAMGVYTLAEYKENVFTVKGVDGYLKCFGVLVKGKNPEAHYFPRKMSGEVEKKDAFTVAYQEKGDTLYFPETTPFLPRSGNIDEETGLGSYWNAGSALEFIQTKEKKNLSEGIEFVENTVENAVSGGNFPEDIGGLEQVMPSRGTAKPLTILIDFPDFHRPRHVTAEGMEEALFSLDREDSLSAYYYRSSYGNLKIDGKVLGWYRTKKNRGEYESDKEIMAEAVNYYIGQGIDLSEYDGDGDGQIDSLYILWAGTLSGEEGIWNVAYRSSWDQSPEEWDRKVTGYIFVPGSTVWSSVPPLKCNTNSLIHETGHLLGLNDYYSYDTGERSEYGGYTGGAPEGGMGGMDMMDANIGDHNIFSKWLLGWAEPEVVEYQDIVSSDGKTFELRPSSKAGDGVFIKLKDSEDLFTELLVIEAVAPVGNASEYTRLKDPVVRVLHVDATVDDGEMEGNWRGYGFANDNSYTVTRFIAPVEADGKDEFLNYIPVKGENRPSYSPKDYFRAGDVIGSDTYPNTGRYDPYGNASISTGLRIEVEEIKKDGTAKVRFSYEEPQEGLKPVEISPKPCIVPYQKGKIQEMPEGVGEIRFRYDMPIDASQKQMKKIKVYSDQEEVKEVQISIKENELIISFEKEPKEGHGYTVVIPHGVLRSTENHKIVNNYNGVYGFLR